MKANAPEKIYIDANEDWHRTYTAFTEKAKGNDIEYIRTDTFIEKAKEFIWSHTEGSDYHVNYVLKEFENFMKGE